MPIHGLNSLRTSQRARSIGDARTDERIIVNPHRKGRFNHLWEALARFAMQHHRQHQKRNVER